MLLEVKNGSFRYKNTKEAYTLRDINFELNSGEIMAILGQNGIGKTTLLKCVIGIFKWERGDTIIKENKMNRKNTKIIGYVPQAHALPFSYLVEDMISFGRTGNISYFGQPSFKDKKKVEEIMELIGIEKLKGRYCNQLSGGQLQLILLARALVSEPELLVLDEPESHLDLNNQIKLLRIIKMLSKERGVACLINTHYPEHAIKISDKVLLLDKNSYVFGKTNEVLIRDNIKKYFLINGDIIQTQHKGINLKNFAVLENI